MEEKKEKTGLGSLRDLRLDSSKKLSHVGEDVSVLGFRANERQGNIVQFGMWCKTKRSTRISASRPRPRIRLTRNSFSRVSPDILSSPRSSKIGPYTNSCSTSSSFAKFLREIIWWSRTTMLLHFLFCTRENSQSKSMGKRRGRYLRVRGSVNLLCCILLHGQPRFGLRKYRFCGSSIDRLSGISWRQLSKRTSAKIANLSTKTIFSVCDE